MHRSHRPGLTLSQLLVVMALLAMLVAFALPAIAKARLQARRNQDSNNLKILGLACHNYHDVNQHFPSGNNAENFSATAFLLPYIEEENLFKKIDFKKASDDDANAAARKTVIKSLMSPRDPQGVVLKECGPTNYLFNAGTGTSLQANNGMFYQDSKLRLTDVTDGTSNTIMTIETLKGNGGTKAVNVQRQHIALKAADLKTLQPESGADDWKNNKNIAGDRCACWIDGRFLMGTINGGRRLNDPLPDVNCGGAGGLAGPRTLDGVVIVGMGDGSVRFLEVKTISQETWRAALTRGGGEVLGSDF